MPPTQTYQEARKETRAEDKLIERKLVPALLERYNTTPTYIMDPRTFGRQFEAIMHGTSSPEEFILAMENLKHQNLSIMLREIQDMLEREDGYDGSYLSSLQALLALAGRDVSWHNGDDWSDCESSSSDDNLGLLAIDEFWFDTVLDVPSWMGTVYDLLPDNTSHLGLPEEYTSGEEDSQSDYSESSVDEEEPVKPNKSQKRGATQSTTSSLSTTASAEGRTLRNGKRTHTPDDDGNDADAIADETPKTKRRRKEETPSSSSRSRSPSPPKPVVGRIPPLGEEDLPPTRRLGRLNRVAGRRSA
ncbi:hypothetical protein CEP52_015149 [Fusarium oligoseptatum]|uniref:Uncharacterized protein n=1 Tax=Fusarium oligoseptatum TaxID=2604345 RepID=A0A428SFR0_9HYPO|nr:hypothetical protein CEP52_015149 [Fusarium oligoseptatum]